MIGDILKIHNTQLLLLNLPGNVAVTGGMDPPARRAHALVPLHHVHYEVNKNIFLKI